MILSTSKRFPFDGRESIDATRRPELKESLYPNRRAHP